jgi:hypothetical protein
MQRPERGRDGIEDGVGDGGGRRRLELASGEGEVVAAAGRGGRRPGRPAAAAAMRGEELTYCSDTMLGIDKLYSLRAKGHNI